MKAVYARRVLLILAAVAFPAPGMPGAQASAPVTLSRPSLNEYQYQRDSVFVVWESVRKDLGFAIKISYDSGATWHRFVEKGIVDSSRPDWQATRCFIPDSVTNPMTGLRESTLSERCMVWVHAVDDSVAFSARSPLFPVRRSRKTVPLWPLPAPGTLTGYENAQPELIGFFPPAGSETGAAVILMPGGSFSSIEYGKEGKTVAEWFIDRGVTAFVLNYRVKPYTYPAPHNDGVRAVRVVRSRAAELGVDATRIGVFGFSAGGHVASFVGTRFTVGVVDTSDTVERYSSRPDYLMLGYPVITMTDPDVHGTSRSNLMGSRVDDTQLRMFLSNQRFVTSRTPPTFLMCGSNDGLFLRNCEMFRDSLTAHGVPVTYFIEPGAGHGYALRGDPMWPDTCLAWMEERGLVVPVSTEQRPLQRHRALTPDRPMRTGAFPVHDAGGSAGVRLVPAGPRGAHGHFDCAGRKGRSLGDGIVR